MGREFDCKIFEKSQIPTPCPIPPPPPHRHYIDRCITFTYDLPGMALFLYNTCKTKGGILDHAVALCNINNLAFTITRFKPKPHRCVPISSFQTTKWTIATGWRFYVHAFTLSLLLRGVRMFQCFVGLVRTKI